MTRYSEIAAVIMREVLLASMESPVPVAAEIPAKGVPSGSGGAVSMPGWALDPPVVWKERNRCGIGGERS